MAEYGFIKEIDLTFDEAEEKVRTELQKEGFGIVSKVDMAEKFKEKLGKDFNKYVILGACNPPHAFNAVLSEPNIGLLLPCNVIIRVNNEGKTVVGIIKPTVAMSMVENEALAPLALSVDESLEKVFNAL